VAALCALAFIGAAVGARAQESANGAKSLRIISLYAAHTELVIRLGGRDSLVGVSQQETYAGPETVGWEWPPAFSINDDVEKFLLAAPDLILVRPQHVNSASNLFDTLRQAGVRVWVRQVTNADDIYAYWRELGDFCGKPMEARQMVADFQIALEPYQANLARADKPGVFIESIHREIKTFTPDSIPIWLLELAGGYNVAQDAEPVRDGLMVANYGPERLLAKAELIDAFIAQDGQMNRVPLETILARDLYRVLPAFKNGRVYKIPEDLISRPTPSLLEGLRLMRGMVYPGAPDNG
jgi:iron complex transport system substrate-binding protein